MDAGDPQDGYLVLLNEGVTTLQPNIRFEFIDPTTLKVASNGHGAAIYDWENEGNGYWKYRRSSHVYRPAA